MASEDKARPYDGVGGREPIAASPADMLRKEILLGDRILSVRDALRHHDATLAEEDLEEFTRQLVQADEMLHEVDGRIQSLQRLIDREVKWERQDARNAQERADALNVAGQLLVVYLLVLFIRPIKRWAEAVDDWLVGVGFPRPYDTSIPPGLFAALALLAAAGILGYAIYRFFVARRLAKSEPPSLAAATFFIIVAFGCLAFAGLAYATQQLGWVAFTHDQDAVPVDYVHYYAWIVIDSVPGLDVWGELQIDPPMEAGNLAARAMGLIFRIGLVVPAFIALGQWLRFRREQIDRDLERRPQSTPEA